MRAHVWYRPRTKAKTLQALKDTKIFSSMRPASMHSIVLQTDGQTRRTKKSEQNRIKNTLDGIPTIVSFSVPLGGHDSGNAPDDAVRITHMFFDIDSTLTHPGIKDLDRGVKNTFAKLRQQKCSVYFCTGRADYEVRELIRMYKTEDYGIAENGGIVINSTLPACKFGDRSEPDKLVRYMNEHAIPYSLDSDQQTRKTEYVITKDSIKRSRLEAAVSESGARVDVHESKNTYHIGKTGINKGTAMMYLTGEKELGLDRTTHLIVAVGDSELDIPMFKHADSSYAVGNANAKVKKSATYCMSANAPKIVGEIYAALFPHAV